MVSLSDPPPVPPDLLFLLPLQPSSQPRQILNLVEQQPGVSHSVHPSSSACHYVSSPIPVQNKPNSPAPVPTSTSKLWASKVKSSFQPLTKIASPTYSDDGIPSILAPESITLKVLRALVFARFQHNSAWSRFPLSRIPDLKPYSNGVIKLRVVVELAKKKPSAMTTSISLEMLSLFDGISKISTKVF
ncbi:hypothetical protein Bca4012_036163 [Brassica carinata]